MTLLAPKILCWLIDFWKICGPLKMDVKKVIFQDVDRFQMTENTV